MNEDLKPCLDIESMWEMVPEAFSNNTQVFKHKDLKSLFRVIDFKKKTIEFRDTLRVPPCNVIDIYKNIGVKRKAEIMGLILKVIHEEKPIKMPYVHEELKVFTQYIENAIGILYYKDSDEKKTIVPIKRFFLITRDPVISFEEISWEDFAKLSISKEETK